MHSVGRLTFLSLLAVYGSAEAVEDRAAARAHYSDGMKYYNLGRYDKAREEFRAAYFAFPDPVFLFDIGQSSRMLSDTEEMIRSYRAFLRERPDAPNRVDIQRFIDQGEADLKRRAAQQPPTGTVAPKEEKPAVEPVSGRVVDRKPARWWVWVVVAAAAIAIGTAIGLITAFTVPKDAAIPDYPLGNGVVRF